MEKLKAVLRDLLVALVVGLAIGLAACLLFGLLGGLIGGSVRSGVVAARSAVLLIGGVTLLFAAVLLLKGGNLPAEAFRFRLKRKHEQPQEDVQPPKPPDLFRIVPRSYTAMVVAVGTLLVSLIPDLILINL